jgi:ribosomal protein S18 acetylase RimI-like enzyme
LDSAITIREGSATDAPAIAALHAASWRDAYRDILDSGFLAGPVEADRAELWIGRMLRPKPNQLVLLAEEAGRLAGFVCAFIDEDPRWGTFVDNLHVAVGLRGKGLGRGLLAEIARHALSAGTRRGLYLWVYEDNRPARAFYEGLGGAVVERQLETVPGGGSAVEIRMHWPDTAALADCAGAVVRRAGTESPPPP